jgi:hypothetical protein
VTPSAAVPGSRSSRRVAAESISSSEDCSLRGGGGQRHFLDRGNFVADPLNRGGAPGGARLRLGFEQDRDPVGLGAEVALQRL